MKDDLNASEKRLIAALDRLDSFIDRMADRAAAPGPDSGQDAPDPDLAARFDEQAEELTQLEERLAATNERLDSAGEEIARLAAANEALVSANRALIAAQPASARDDIRDALQAELDSLRAARAAEIGQMSDIAGTLDRMLGAPTAVERKPAQAKASAPAVIETPVSPDDAGDLDLGGDTLSDARETQAADENRG
ncbi:hypothetical protein RM190_08035 [Paracoccus sp. CPCC 101403]|uniref:Uncharacterized protein n=1 Tax=Paracoccus broussonetiae TaxID=3075834 RepID=A0ABU3EC61_9RHOB|nr:hypothetical protein [Paracoccus sp. CPCC 101403]MDT1061802.1 hypothetical protein [Paracoccus sp. CPCC 101403]